MQRFLITYDLLGGSEEEYEDLIDALESAGAVHVQLSVWYLKDEDDEHECEELADLFRKFLKKRDRILVVKFVDFCGYKSITKISEP